MEKYLELHTVKALKGLGAKVYKMESVVGIPDRLILYKGGYFFIEFKNPNKKGRITKAQIARMEELREIGARVFVISDKQESDQLVRDFFYDRI